MKGGICVLVCMDLGTLGFCHWILSSCASPFQGMDWISIQNKDDAWRIVRNQWYWDKDLISIKLWHLLFDVREEVMANILICIKLPNFPMEFWLDVGFKAIGRF